MLVRGNRCCFEITSHFFVVRVRFDFSASLGLAIVTKRGALERHRAALGRVLETHKSVVHVLERSGVTISIHPGERRARVAGRLCEYS